MAGVIPYLTIPGGRAKDAVAFYTAAFGATEQGRHDADDGRRLMHAHLSLNGGDLMLSDEFPEHGAQVGVPDGTTLHLQVEDADAIWETAVEAGAIVKMPLEDQFWGDRYGQLRDPFGFTWSIGGPKKNPA